MWNQDSYYREKMDNPPGEYFYNQLESFSNSQIEHLRVTEAKRNARERERVKEVNCAFALLRSHIPVVKLPEDRRSSRRRRACQSFVYADPCESLRAQSLQQQCSKRISKAKTLHYAIGYIKYLSSLLEGRNEKVNDDHSKISNPAYVNLNENHSLITQVPRYSENPDFRQDIFQLDNEVPHYFFT